ncbi:methylated-DNA--[protein]-cysteine S-methyltransferase [Candidatus Oleimmundimicrobium sp.]|uniref:methylated-DNA--[protein]-cysteine S-methyltransferase n=1 Tax=Candidatus Oleimmundimicrobium sp. TaxID=3060597 RepID=UPI00272802CE|nr:methylated-DNA--[protein]-cysteine S-methyltransferase [Candidatus Oleimmundimicrobium sp.]MDO8885714.1 methylated-DNA--[protein]-cysteine S-methyltransferase [Candidatus Oleimmundimicrobium sp.]
MKSHNFSLVYYEVLQGRGALVFSDKGLTNLILPYSKKEEFELEFRKKFSGFSKCKVVGFSNEKNCLIRSLLNYFEGQKIKFNYVLDLRGFSEFERKVYNTVSSIPYGELRSYKWVADKIDKSGAYRAVGNVLAKNPIPIVIPCHRIVKNDGKIGGWSGKEGWKRKLLKLEGLRIEN